MKISGCILAKNEEKQIADCINSIKSFTDEIIVIDNGSTDLTKEIAAGLGCKVISVENGSESDLRNEYLKNAKGDWIFSIDADERVTGEFGNIVLKSIKKCNNNIWGFRLPMYNYFGNGKWSSIITCRVFRNMKEIFYTGGDIHPTIASSIYYNNKNLGFIPAPIHHLDALIKNRTPKKREQYIRKMKKFINNNPNNINTFRLLNYLGVEYTAIKKFDKAAEYYKLSGEKDIKNSALSLLYLSQQYLLEKKFDEAAYEIKKILNMDYKEVLRSLGFELTDNLLEDIKIMSDDLTQRSLTILAELEIQKNNYEQAEIYCKEALNLWPFASQHYLNIASIIKNKNKIRADEYIKKAIIHNPYLTDDIIYLNGYKPNIYEQQTSLLSISDEIFQEIRTSVSSSRGE